MSRERVDLVIGVPTMYWFWVNAPEFDDYDLDSVKYTISNGAPAAPELIKKLSEKLRNSKLINAGGMTESTAFTFTLHPSFALTKLGSIGWSTPGMEIKVVRPDGEDTEVNETGELLYRGTLVCKGYWNKPEVTKQTFVKGWLHTGDLGKVDEDGFLFLVDRKKDRIIRGGGNIYSVEVENALCAHPKVLEAAVVGCRTRSTASRSRR